ncbi:glutathione S-transferase family protein [Janthinobacterium sp. BJB1]|uniref:glutathione S-transferase family protein n=1 Tax=Janthinobacterium sp. GW458P TaxID=1981504 RepID=UPI000A3207BB|nr:glutathione S-transferase family protein [Janthinobacterium sp. GW458P]MBE3027811.1 glutathione S-transferase family protein [Janthinobacterium sp. GW458P]PJC98964.1 glutathione S-transferase family protein [Janthinobacterium sp. BJB1]
MRLYHHPMSSNARRALMTAIHLDLPLELAEVDLMNADDRRRLAELNPNGKVPVLADGDFLLWESCAIMQYLAEQVPGQTLYPQAPQARADVNRWLFWAAQHFAPAISVLTWEHAWKGITGGGPADPLEVARGERDLAECAVVLDAYLAGRSWLSGEALTLADFAVAAPLMYSERVQLPLGQYANIQAWFARVRQLRAWQETEVTLIGE